MPRRWLLLMLQLLLLRQRWMQGTPRRMLRRLRPVMPRQRPARPRPVVPRLALELLLLPARRSK